MLYLTIGLFSATDTDLAGINSVINYVNIYHPAASREPGSWRELAATLSAFPTLK